MRQASDELIDKQDAGTKFLVDLRRFENFSASARNILLPPLIQLSPSAGIKTAGFGSLVRNPLPARWLIFVPLKIAFR